MRTISENFGAEPMTYHIPPDVATTNLNTKREPIPNKAHNSMQRRGNGYTSVACGLKTLIAPIHWQCLKIDYSNYRQFIEDVMQLDQYTWPSRAKRWFSAPSDGLK
ncbi:hypothetical protein PROFUN_06804 [Planoprotostelium fungivorum]|uniref:Uncharacterized protein n=1 Tax=Planoprotostelium fungivorum TaxID=1890364 RepID=A0A2P6NNQ6_9EUKA|nr:hypothetical protein PROFUN_06804 [Planoprotostelium fungivorum]